MPKGKIHPEYILLSLIIFTLPFNWFLKWESDSSFLRGIQIDYLLPKIYFQDILLFCLAFYFVYSFRHQLALHIKQKVSRFKCARIDSSKAHTFSARLTNVAHGLTNNLTSILLMSLVLIVGLRTIATQQASSYAGFFQLSSATAFAYYLYKRFSLARLLKLVWPPLVAITVMQSVIGIYQYIFQKSLVGYTLFGEIDLSLPGAIARESFFGTLRILPYGTLPHPNILAGLVGIVSIMVWFNIQSHRKKNHYLTLKYILLGLFIFVILLTQSWVAISGISLIYVLSCIPSRYSHTMLFCLISVISVLYIVLPTWFDYQSIIDTDNTSIMRRLQLNVAGFFVLKDHVWFGTGLNQSLKPMHTTHSSLTPAEFIQPIHSIYLLWFVETGVIGALLVTLVIFGIVKRALEYEALTNPTGATLTFATRSAWLGPLLFIAWIGIFDHYLVTIRQGQLLAALVIALTLSSNKEVEG